MVGYYDQFLMKPVANQVQFPYTLSELSEIFDPADTNTINFEYGAKFAMANSRMIQHPINANFNCTKKFSVCFTRKILSVGVDRGYISNSKYNTANSWGWAIAAGDGNNGWQALKVFIATNSLCTTFFTATLKQTVESDNNNLWSKAVVVIDLDGAASSDKIKIYLDGVLQTVGITYAGAAPASFTASNQPFNIGAWELVGFPTRYCDMIMRDIGFWKEYNLNQTEITSLYNSANPVLWTGSQLSGGLITNPTFWLQCQELSGTRADSTGTLVAGFTELGGTISRGSYARGITGKVSGVYLSNNPCSSPEWLPTGLNGTPCLEQNGWSFLDGPCSQSQIANLSSGDIIAALNIKGPLRVSTQTTDLTAATVNNNESGFWGWTGSTTEYFFIASMSNGSSVSSSTGTVGIVNGVVTLTGSTFTIYANKSTITVGGNTYEIRSYNSSTQITLVNLAINVTSGAAYTLTTPIQQVPCLRVRNNAVPNGTPMSENAVALNTPYVFNIRGLGTGGLNSYLFRETGIARVVENLDAGSQNTWVASVPNKSSMILLAFKTGITVQGFRYLGSFGKIAICGPGLSPANNILLESYIRTASGL